MMRKVNPTLVGAFVLGAIGLVMAIVILFGGGKLFQKTVPVVMYFEGSVQGLQLGSVITAAASKSARSPTFSCSTMPATRRSTSR
jgi:paraquat-inducible protein B